MTSVVDMDCKGSTLEIKDPMRDSLLSSDCEVDPDGSQPGTPVEEPVLISDRVPTLIHEEVVHCPSPNGSSLILNDDGSSLVPHPLLEEEQSWEGIGQCQDIFRADDDLADERDHPHRRNRASPNDEGDSPDASHQDIAGSLELEFDYWQGQFEFCSPALQDYPFIPVNLLERLAGSEEQCGTFSGNVYKDLISTVKILQNKVEVLGDNHSDSQDRIVRVKQDNSVLQTRVMMLEEQLRDSEHRAEERLAEEQRRNKELIQRIEREKMLTVENYTIRQTNLEETNKRLEEEVQRLRAKVDRHQKERNELEDRALEAEQAALASREECKKAAGQSRREMQDDQERSAKVVAELRAEVERLTAVLETSARTRLPSTDSNTASSEHLMLALQSVKEENKGLHEQLEELQDQLLTRGLEEGRVLVTNMQNNSLAAEFEAMTQEEAEQVGRELLDELQKKLRETQEVNKHLRDYIDGILLTIVENHPQLLEVKHKQT